MYLLQPYFEYLPSSRGFFLPFLLIRWPPGISITFFSPIPSLQGSDPDLTGLEGKLAREKENWIREKESVTWLPRGLRWREELAIKTERALAISSQAGAHGLTFLVI